jgi:hypothetical protein
VERQHDARRRRQLDDEHPLENPQDLRHPLEHAVGHKLTGDFMRLFRLMDSVIEPLTSGALAGLGNTEEMLAKGVEVAGELGLHETGGDDDVLCYTLALMPMFGPEFQELAKSWRGPANDMKNAILNWKK